MGKVDDTKFHYKNLTPAQRLLVDKSGFTMSWIDSFVHPDVVKAVLEIFEDYIKLNGTIS